MGGALFLLVNVCCVPETKGDKDGGDATEAQRQSSPQQGSLQSSPTPPPHLVRGRAEDEHVVGADLLGDLDVGAVHRADDQAAVHLELHVAGARRLGAGRRDVLRELRGCARVRAAAARCVIKRCAGRGVSPAQIKTTRHAPTPPLTAPPAPPPQTPSISPPPASPSPALPSMMPSLPLPHEKASLHPPPLISLSLSSHPG